MGSMVHGTPAVATFSSHGTLAQAPASSPASTSTATQSSVKPTPKKARTTFASLLSKSQDEETSKSPGKRKHETVYLEDLDSYQVAQLPAQCEVTDPRLQDDHLCDDYASLPHLRAGTLLPWSQFPGPGNIMFSSWGNIMPNMAVELCEAALRFVHSGNYLNPSRASPQLTRAIRITPSGFRQNLLVDSSPAVLVTCIYTTASYLVTPSMETSVVKKQIQGIVHSQEWERMVGFLCMVFGQKELHAQLSADSIAFETRQAVTKANNNAKASKSGLFSSIRSPSVKHSSSSQRSFFSLACEDDVPVYDGTDSVIDYMQDLPRLAEVLAPWGGEIPHGSFTVVGYTASMYRTEKVIGVPESA
ncbi:hypothetical protein NLJ89_g11585 [Agrocybe chaxingu]|uniref:Uncharacterized protein n=1 Tax=Agrocybe chaxingu TaxID=84603 RepID=A0A9W8JPR2_9AGAR|nr:hypothetical protein NLJ89_g11585 [Agrocybe chaxingu]